MIGQLVFRANVDGRHSQATSTFFSGSGLWHHFAGVVDQESRTITGYLDGSGCGWMEEKIADQIEPDIIEDDRRLIIGGYTDAARWPLRLYVRPSRGWSRGRFSALSASAPSGRNRLLPRAGQATAVGPLCV